MDINLIGVSLCVYGCKNYNDVEKLSYISYEKDFTLKMQLIRLHFTIKAELFATYESRYIFCNIKNGCKMFIA
ncbi:MAG: hypothetical protein Q8942_14380, partial [Bacillota bacterium]|nr:hypothetical protein [Bacillota bacterium]